MVPLPWGVWGTLSLFHFHSILWFLFNCRACQQFHDLYSCSFLVCCAVTDVGVWLDSWAIYYRWSCVQSANVYQHQSKMVWGGLLLLHMSWSTCSSRPGHALWMCFALCVIRFLSVKCPDDLTALWSKFSLAGPRKTVYMHLMNEWICVTCRGPRWDWKSCQLLCLHASPCDAVYAECI